MRRLHITLPDGLVEEIDEVVGKRGRSAFIGKAARFELMRRRQGSASAAVQGA